MWLDISVSGASRGGSAQPGGGRQRQAAIRRAKEPDQLVRPRQIGSGAGIQESGVTGGLFGSLTGAALRASRCHVGADPLGEGEGVFEEAGEATMRSGKAALGLATAAGLCPGWRGG